MTYSLNENVKKRSQCFHWNSFPLYEIKLKFWNSAWAPFSRKWCLHEAQTRARCLEIPQVAKTDRIRSN